MTLLLEHFDTLLTTPADVEHLNRAILTLAVQGKLVAQDPNDEPASDLLKRLQKVTNRKVQPINSADEPYKLPKGWIWAKTGELYEIIGGGTPSTKAPEYWDGYIPWITSADILGPKEIRIRKTITEAALKQSTTNLVPAESIVVVTRVGLGKVGLTSVPLCFSQDSHALIANSAFIYPDYALYCLLVAAQSFRENSRGTTIFGITRSQLENVPFALPPYEEQIRIIQKIELMFTQTSALAEKLASAESELAGLNRSALAHLLSSDSPEAFNQQWDFIAAHFESLFTRPEHIAPLRQSILELAVRGKLTRREAGDESARELLKRIREEKEESGKKEVLAPVKESEKPFALPDGWECIRLAEIADIGTGVAKGKKYNPDEKVISLPYLRVANVQRGYLALEEMKEIEIREDEYERYALQNGDLLLTEGGDADKLGRSAIWHGEVENCIHQNHIFRARPYSELKSEWLMLYTNSPLGRNYFLGASKQTTNLASINKTQLSNCPVPIPPLAEQARIVARVEQLLGLCEALESRLRAAQEERSRLVVSVLNNVQVLPPIT
ncbi:MAG: restriction endonuclease subunit S [Anaerolineae bacterium]|nr:restriction endonuclease subunit S [Anaerolineae bacterium]